MWQDFSVVLFAFLRIKACACACMYIHKVAMRLSILIIAQNQTDVMSIQQCFKGESVIDWDNESQSLFTLLLLLLLEKIRPCV